MNYDLLEFAFLAGRLCNNTVFDWLFCTAMFLLVVRMTLWIVRVILDMVKKYDGAADGWYPYSCDTVVPPGIVEQIRNKKRWRCSRWAWWCAVVFCCCLFVLAAYCWVALWGCK